MKLPPLHCVSCVVIQKRFTLAYYMSGFGDTQEAALTDLKHRTEGYQYVDLDNPRYYTL